MVGTPAKRLGFLFENAGRALLGLILSVAAAGCSDADLKGSSGALHFQNLDAVGKTGALLRNVPGDPSNVTTLAVEVYAVDFYSYKLVDGNADCDALDRPGFSAFVPVSQLITDAVGADGRKTLCVFGRDGSGTLAQFQVKATVAQWTKATVPPGKFEIEGPTATVGKLPVTVTWDASAGAASYNVVVASDEGCTQQVGGGQGISGTSYVISSLPDGIYHVCVTAVDPAGNEQKATNDGVPFTLDAVPPGPFNITAPAALSADTTPTVTWTAAAAAASSQVTYDVTVATDAGCANVVTSQEHVAATQLAVANQLADGNYFVCVTAGDLAGHTTAATNSPYPFTVNTQCVIPLFDPTTLPAPVSNVTSKQIGIEANPALAAVKWKVGAKAAIDCDSDDEYSTPVNAVASGDTPFTIENLPGPPTSAPGTEDGPWTVCVMGIATNGLAGCATSPRAASYTWTKVTQPPAIAFNPALPPFCGPNGGPTGCPAAGATSIPVAGNAQAATSDSIAGSAVELSVLVGSGSCLAADGSVGTTPPTVTATATTCPTFAESLDSSGAFHYQVPVAGLTNGTQIAISASATTVAGNQAETSAKITWVTALPQISSLVLDQTNPASTRAAVIPVAVTATDPTPIVKLAKLCLQSVNGGPVPTTPSATASCWQPWTVSANSTTMAVPYFTVGYTPQASYQVYAWVMDAAGNISAPVTRSIEYNPVPVPLLNGVLATSDMKPAIPPSTTERTAASGSTIYIEWTAVQQQGGDPLDPKSIALYYTTDDLTWETIATGLQLAGSNSGCAVPQVQANVSYANQVPGCYVWTSPSSGYLRVRAAVGDIDGQIIFSTAPALNTPSVNYLAGNTENSLGASARATVFQGVAAGSGSQDPGILAVDQQGDFFYMDHTRGLFVIDTHTGVMNLLLPINAKAQVSDDPVNLTLPASLSPPSQPALVNPQGLTMTVDNNVLIQDGTRLRLLKYNNGTSTPTIETVAGGGTDTSDSVADAHKLSMAAITYPASRLLVASPDRKIYFRSEEVIGTANRIRILDLDSGQVSSLYLGAGQQFTWQSQTSPSNFNDCDMRVPTLGFDAQGKLNLLMATVYGTDTYTNSCYTSVGYRIRWAAYASGATPGAFIGSATGDDMGTYGLTAEFSSSVTGMDGSAWVFDRVAGRILTYNPSTNKFSLVVGTGVLGECADGTPATSCPINPIAAFVDQSGRLFFVDGTRIRTIDVQNGVQVVVTVFGQALSYGDGLDPLSARFGFLENFAQWGNIGSAAQYSLLDALTARLREFGLGASSPVISTLAGNGSQSPIVTVAHGGTASTPQSMATTSSGPFFDDFGFNPATGDLYLANYGVLPATAAKNYVGKTVVELITYNRSSEVWTNFAGGGTTDWRTTTTTPDANVNLAFSFVDSSGFDTASYQNRILGFDGSNVLTVKDTYHQKAPAGEYDVMLDLFGVAAGGSMTYVGGVLGAPSATTPCAAGTSLSTCVLYGSYEANEYTHAQYLTTTTNGTTTGQWLLGMGNQKNLYSLTAPSGNVQVFEVLARPFTAFAYRAGTGSASSVIYYCGTDGNLYRHAVGAGTAAETKLAIGSSQMQCTGRTMYWSDGRSSVSFLYRLNGLYGLAEYVDQ